MKIIFVSIKENVVTIIKKMFLKRLKLNKKMIIIYAAVIMKKKENNIKKNL